MKNHTITYGYKLENAEIQIHEEEAKIINFIFKTYIKEKSLATVVNKLYKNKTPSPAGKEKWTHSTIGKIIINEIYLGNNKYPKILDNNTFTTANNIKNKIKNKITNLITYENIFKDKIFCDKCGETYVTHTKVYKAENNKKKVKQQKCKNYMNSENPCRNVIVSDEEIKQIFMSLLKKLITGEIKYINNTKEKSEKINIEKYKAEINMKPEEKKDYIFKSLQEIYYNLEIKDRQYQNENIRNFLLTNKNKIDFKNFNKLAFNTIIKNIIVNKDSLIFILKNQTKIIIERCD